MEEEKSVGTYKLSKSASWNVLPQLVTTTIAKSTV